MSAIARRAGDGPVPLTPAQARIWRLEQAGFDGSTHLITTSRRLTGPLDPQAMARALTTVIGRHEALHTAILGRQDRPIQTIQQPDLAAALEQTDFTHLSAQQRETAARQWTDELLKRPFRLDRPPALRIGLARLGEHDHLMLFCVHHIICDAASLAILRDELFTLYRSQLDGIEPAPPPPTAQFLDYAAWLAGRDHEDRDEDREYWRHHLLGAPPVVTLPPDHPRPTRAGTRGGRVTLVLPPGFGDAVAQSARRQRCTSFILVQAALAVVLARRSGQSNVVIGTPVDNRDRPELERAVGMFVNMLALRTDLSGDPTLSEVLTRVRSTTIGGLAHRHLPFDEVVEILGVPCDAGHHPVFQVQLVTDPARPDRQVPDGLRIAPGYKPTPDARFDLTVLYDSGTPKVYADYNVDLYDASTVEDLLHHMAAVMTAFTETVELRVSQLP
ncbi:MAG TPA: condensation domain-containing protein [Candidatus Limnocylindrales bacterium]|nr:condensation domain-containing protein [Candidatus Limnocylindrales bacterium]